MEETDADLILYQKIDEILWFDWDPIEVKSFLEQGYAVRDEYYSYISGALKLKKEAATTEEIAEYLLKIEVERMGLHKRRKRCMAVAIKIFEL